MQPRLDERPSRLHLTGNALADLPLRFERDARGVRFFAIAFLQRGLYGAQVFGLQLSVSCSAAVGVNMRVLLCQTGVIPFVIPFSAQERAPWWFAPRWQAQAA